MDLKTISNLTRRNYTFEIFHAVGGGREWEARGKMISHISQGRIRERHLGNHNTFDTLFLPSEAELLLIMITGQQFWPS